MRPGIAVQVERGQHLEGDRRQCATRFAFVAFVGFKGSNQGRQGRVFVWLADEPGEPGGAPCFARLRVHHFHHVRQRRVVADGGIKQLCFRRGVQPVLNEFFRAGTEGFASNHAAAHDLREVTQHFAAVHDAVKHRRAQRYVAHRQHRQQQRGHVFHVAAFAGVNRSLGEKFRGNLPGEFEHLRQLGFRACVVGAVQAAGSGKLRQLLCRGLRVGAAARFVVGVGGSLFLFARWEQFEISHDFCPSYMNL